MPRRSAAASSSELGPWANDDDSLHAGNLRGDRGHYQRRDQRMTGRPGCSSRWSQWGARFARCSPRVRFEASRVSAIAFPQLVGRFASHVFTARKSSRLALRVAALISSREIQTLSRPSFRASSFFAHANTAESPRRRTSLTIRAAIRSCRDVPVRACAQEVVFPLRPSMVGSALQHDLVQGIFDDPLSVGGLELGQNLPDHSFFNDGIHRHPVGGR